MPAHAGSGLSRKLKRHELCDSADLLNGCSWTSYGTDQSGELPISKDIFLWKKDKDIRDTKTLCGCASSTQKQGLDKQFLRFNKRKFGKKSHVAEKQSQSVAFKSGLQKNLPQQCSGFHAKSYYSCLKSSNQSQCGCYDFTQPFLWDTNDTRESIVVHSANDGFVHYNFNSGCYLYRPYLTADLKGSRISNRAKERKNLLPAARFYEFSNRQSSKKRKILMSIDNYQPLQQTAGEFWPHDSSDHFKNFDNSPLIQPIVVMEPCSTMNRAKARRFDGSGQCKIPSVTKHATKSDSQKISSELLGAGLLAFDDVKNLDCGDFQDGQQQTEGGNSKPCDLIGNTERKALTTDHSETCQVPGLSIRNQGARRRTSVKPQKRFKHVSMLKVQRKKKSEDPSIPVRTPACSKHHSIDIGARKKHADSPSDRLAASREALTNCPKEAAFELKEDNHEYGSSASMGFKFRSLSQKYRQKVLQDLIGQGLVARARSNAISKDKVAPVYLFQGSQGTGKTSAARIFAMALNCMTPEEKRPCGLCCQCTAMISGNTRLVWELDAASHNGIGLVHELINEINFATSGPLYKIVIIDECHVFSCQTWSSFRKVFEEPLPNVVFILITTEPDKLPDFITSRCHRFHFFRIMHTDIVDRLCCIAKLENIITEPGALSLIASKSDGSLRSAENILDQVSLLEQRITVATIHKLAGSVSHGELSRLLDSALRSDIIRTVQKTKEIVEVGVDPLDLLSQLATLIADILAGSYVPTWRKIKEANSVQTYMELEKLRTTLKILLEAEKQIRVVSLGRTTWLIAALLQLGPILQEKSQSASLSKNLAKASSTTMHRSKRARSIKLKVCDERRGNAKRKVLKEMTHKENNARFEQQEGLLKSLQNDTQLGECPVIDESSSVEVEASANHAKLESSYPETNSSINLSNRQQSSRKLSALPKESNPSAVNEQFDIHFRNPCNVRSLWLTVLKQCRPLSVRGLLQNHAKLLALTFSSDSIVAHVELEKPAEKKTLEMYHVSITTSLKKVFGPTVKVHFTLASGLQSSAGNERCHAAADVPFIPSICEDGVGFEGNESQIRQELSPPGRARIAVRSFQSNSSSDDLQDLCIKKRPRSRCLRLSAGSHAKRILCDWFTLQNSWRQCS